MRTRHPLPPAKESRRTGHLEDPHAEGLRREPRVDIAQTCDPLRRSTSSISTSCSLNSASATFEMDICFSARLIFFESLTVFLRRDSFFTSSSPAFLFDFSTVDDFSCSPSMSSGVFSSCCHFHSCAGAAARTLVHRVPTVLVHPLCRCRLLVFSSF